MLFEISSEKLARGHCAHLTRLAALIERNILRGCKTVLDIADEILVLSNGEVKNIGKKQEVLPHLSEIYSTCSKLEEAEDGTK